MEDIRQQLDTSAIRKSVADESYFVNAKQWFDEIYHRPLVERSFFILIMALSALTIFFSAITYLSMLPLSRTVPYTIYSDDLAEELPIISKLRSKPAEDINVAVARFLLSNYLKEREAFRYDVTKLEWQFNRIRSTSGEKEFQRYQRFINPENPSSPFNKYGRSATRTVSIYDIRMDLASYPSRATLYFTTNVARGKQQQQNNWVTNITFRFPKLTVDQNTNEVLQWNTAKETYELAEKIDFRVGQYNVQEVTHR
ncbi:MAG: VirB8/TrbF family protein [Rickettsiales bacterium]|nr:VirB8/TrbF family protein [Rickettsiales bacterium]